ncbi:TlpA disulfide reductase family protein [Mucilaginibacter sp.]|uniref:TlpA family protein disulfide reductase n=1 Tax=Mucilaginibacter sp. TaxID=1882438 RepID=UPI0028468C53|nr:TlpA disulfide reductase family protein [Mucilaginibacter sp.]MDR3693696.1 TlpA disulfide reductase family protein [Mucilaginibacter sp.]
MNVNFKLVIKLASIIFFASANFLYAQEIFPGSLTIHNIELGCNKIKTGGYTYHDNYTKLSIGEDTTTHFVAYQCYFEENSNDTIIGYKLSNSWKYNKTLYENYTFYNVDLQSYMYKVFTFPPDSEAIHRLANDNSIYPFHEILLRSLKANDQNNFDKNCSYVKMELFDNQSCYVVERKEISNNPNRSVQTLIYINATSFIPIRSLVTITNHIGKVVEKQIFDYWINNFQSYKYSKFNSYKSELVNYSRDTTKKEVERDSSLSNGTVAPQWSLPSLSGKNISLNSLRGNIVIMDFWYKACIPCYKQMMALEKLKLRYKNKKVVFLGVNTLDDPVKDKLELFLQNRNINMLNVYNGRSIEKRYKIYATPCIYIIDKNGYIIYSHVGFSGNVLQDVITSISKRL